MDGILHHASLRMRITGAGNLDTRLLALSEDPVTEVPPSQTLNPLAMTTAPPVFPVILANFSHQYVHFEFSVDEIDEYFSIDKITFYVKELYSMFPM
jgi:hypothetical protein